MEVQGFLCLQVQRVQRQHQIDGGEDQTSTSSFRDEMLTQRKHSRLNQDSSKFVLSFEGCLLCCLITFHWNKVLWLVALHNQPQKCYGCSPSPVFLFSSLFSSIIRLSHHHSFKFLDFTEPFRRTTDGWCKKTFRVDHLQNINKKLLKFKLKTKGHSEALRPEVRSLVTTGFR